MIRVPAGTKMTPELLGELITKHKTEVTNRYQKLKDAYENHYEIYGLRPKTELEARQPDLSQLCKVYC